MSENTIKKNPFSGNGDGIQSKNNNNRENCSGHKNDKQMKNNPDSKRGRSGRRRHRGGSGRGYRNKSSRNSGNSGNLNPNHQRQNSRDYRNDKEDCRSENSRNSHTKETANREDKPGNPLKDGQNKIIKYSDCDGLVKKNEIAQSLKSSEDKTEKRPSETKSSDSNKMEENKSKKDITIGVIDGKNQTNSTINQNLEKSTISKLKAEELSDISSDSDSSDSADSTIKELTKAVTETFRKRQADTTAKLILKKEKGMETSSSSSSSDSSSESEISLKIKQIKKENHSEDEVVCLGSLENIENLTDNEEEEKSAEPKKICLLCNIKGHTSFCCFMICKNCGEKYHGHKDCPKPANVSIVLQNFMEFCMNQFHQYNPERRYFFNQVEDPNNYNGENMRNVNKKRSKLASSLRSSHVPSKSSRKRDRKTETDSSSDESVHKQERSFRRKSSRRQNIEMNTFPQVAINSGYPTVPAFPFNPQGMPFNSQGLAINPLFGYAQMMGFNPLNFSNSKGN